MMPRRAASSSYSNSHSDVLGSRFDERKPPALPRGLLADVRSRAKVLLLQNPHLWGPAQVELVVRLAKLRSRFEAMEARVAADGEIFEHPVRGPIPHPLLTPMSAAAGAALTLERALAIAFVARGTQVKKAELKAPPTAGDETAKKGGPPRLKLA